MGQIQYFREGILSNWYPLPIIDADVEYNCVDQYYLAKKALMFEDTEHYKQIMNTMDTEQLHQIGKQIRHVDKDKWDKHKIKIMFHANKLKYEQNILALKALLQTRGKLLAYASATDTFWGTGAGIEEVSENSPSNWKGYNVLGNILTVLRDTHFALTQVVQIDHES
jgi:ribA/ribD-fused uncharacterized protein